MSINVLPTRRPGAYDPCSRANEVRLWLSLIAYNLGNLWRRLAREIGKWSLTSLQQRLVKIGTRLIKHARYYWLLLAESQLTRRLFRAMLGKVVALPHRRDRRWAKRRRSLLTTRGRRVGSAQGGEQTMFSGFFTAVRALTGPSGAQGSSLDPNGPQSLPQEAASCDDPVEVKEAKRKFRLKQILSRNSRPNLMKWSMKRSIFTFIQIGIFALVALPASAQFASAPLAPPASEIDQEVSSALSSLYANNAGARSLGARAKAILVFPDIKKGAFLVGAQYGFGALRKRGITVGYYRTAAASYGFQAGVKKFA